MYTILRDAPIGRCFRFLSNGRCLGRYVEQQSDFVLPPKYGRDTSVDGGDVKQNGDGDSSGRTSTSTSIRSSKCELENEKADHPDLPTNSMNPQPLSSGNKEEHGFIVVDWYSDSDPENPHNWSVVTKGWISFLVFIYTFACYIGSSLYTSSLTEVIHIFGVSQTVATLGLSLYIVGYGISPLILAPLSEISAIGRMPPYITSFFLFVVLCIPQVLVNNFAGLLVIRFLLGVTAGPAIGNAGAVFPDYFAAQYQSYAIALWGGGASLGPGLGPIVGNFAVDAMGWRWSSWELFWLAAPVFVLMFFTMPETSHDLILLDRARRLRALTGRSDIKSPSEVRDIGKKFTPSQALFDSLIKPWEINIKDPAVLFTTIYSGLVYGMYYSFFESFPIVYGEIYGWSFGIEGLAYIGVMAGLGTGAGIICAYYYFYGDAYLAKIERERGSIPPEARLLLGLYATFCLPAGLFIFAWTARASVHWFPSILGAAVAMIGMLIVFQSMLLYLPFTYPRYVGSLFAANGLARSLLAAAATLFATPMFRNLGIPGGVSLIAGFTLVFSFGMHILYYYGPALRKRSKFAES